MNSDYQDLRTAHPLQTCWDLQLGGLGADALRVALECGLFDQLREFASAQHTATALALDSGAAGYLLELLWCLGLLERDQQHPPRYRNLPMAELHLRAEASGYCGDALLFRHRVLRQTGNQLGDYLRNGMTPPPLSSPTIAQGWANAARLQIAQEQRVVTSEVACALIERLPECAQLQRVLDLGGGPGLVAIALAERLPNLTGVVFEYPETAEVAEDNIQRAGLGERLQAVGGDLNHDDIGSGFDLIWCSSVLHFVHDLPAMLRRLHAALRPGGLLLCCQAEVPDERQAAAQVLPYYLHMRLQGRHVLAEGELARQLQGAGFSAVQQLNGLRFPVTPVNAVIARRAQG
ncbi:MULTISPECIES: class I SAM-dependent methyltransferase [Pseudomonas]|uniref:SAM-dependent methyltransferase n=1 Tax=Pseudomonas hunanensis TaxID=1247546 RepID=A0ACC6K0V6_9PSED|nr:MULTISPECIES: class I SAM-dependent methyltransferase [Pseudomonas]MBP2260204.1 SAM-dependent methyltransferase [Pseudomonas sp. BP8]MDR6712055.1 SAM-dependent methyltransferase [Pseudomonas hunanensis]HDS1736121.1 class I SAM-dependent methyltransferase [Pseudomonas putida]